jgi:hypothetical protein
MTFQIQDSGKGICFNSENEIRFSKRKTLDKVFSRGENDCYERGKRAGNR